MPNPPPQFLNHLKLIAVVESIKTLTLPISSHYEEVIYSLHYDITYFFIPTL